MLVDLKLIMNNLDSNSIVVYRSRQEQAYDEFITENPEYVLGFIGVILVIVAFYRIFKK